MGALEMGDISTSVHMYWRLNKISCRVCLLSYWFFRWQKITFKSCLELYVIHPLLIFNLLIYSFYLFSDLRKRYTLRLLSRETGGFCCFPGKDWERVSRKLLPLGKLYQRIWLQNLPMTLLILVVSKALNEFKEKRACKARKMQVFLQNLPNEIFGMFLRRAW